MFLYKPWCLSSPGEESLTPGKGLDVEGGYEAGRRAWGPWGVREEDERVCSGLGSGAGDGGQPHGGEESRNKEGPIRGWERCWLLTENSKRSLCPPTSLCPRPQLWSWRLRPGPRRSQHATWTGFLCVPGNLTLDPDGLQAHCLSPLETGIPLRLKFASPTASRTRLPDVLPRAHLRGESPGAGVRVLRQPSGRLQMQGGVPARGSVCSPRDVRAVHEHERTLLNTSKLILCIRCMNQCVRVCLWKTYTRHDFRRTRRDKPRSVRHCAEFRDLEAPSVCFSSFFFCL